MRLARLVAIAAVVIAGCGSSANSARPLIDDIPLAISALESSIGSDLEYFEVSADLAGVTLILAETAESDSGEASGMYATTYRFEDG